MGNWRDRAAHHVVQVHPPPRLQPPHAGQRHNADQTEPACLSEQLCARCCAAFKVRRRRDDVPDLWMGQLSAQRRGLWGDPQCENAVSVPFVHTDTYFSFFQRGTLISCSAWKPLSWVMTRVLMRILSKLPKTWSVLATWREGRTPVR